MSSIFASIGLSDTDRTLVNKVGQGLIFSAVSQYLERLNAELDMLFGFFVERQTEDYTERYYLPGNGYMQELDPWGEGQPKVTKAYGYWDVAYPLKDFRDALGANDIAMAYMTVEQLARHVDGIATRYANSMRYEILTALMARSNVTWSDPIHGSLTVRKLANTDGTLYPPVIGSMTEADDEHYAESGTSTTISDALEPWVGTGMAGTFSIIQELEEHFGIGAGNSEIVSFINKADVSAVSGLTKFVAISPAQILEGSGTAQAVLTPAGLPSTSAVIGRHRDGAWIVRWDYIPNHYILSVHTGAPRPLIRRNDPADTGLPSGLRLVARDENFPMEVSTWRCRTGFGVGNRLNGVVVEMGTGGSYSDPTLV